MSLKVWIDQDLCTGDGLCAELAPAVFEMHDDGLAYVKEMSAAARRTIVEGRGEERGGGSAAGRAAACGACCSSPPDRARPMSPAPR